MKVTCLKVRSVRSLQSFHATVFYATYVVGYYKSSVKKLRGSHNSSFVSTRSSNYDFQISKYILVVSSV